MSVSTLTKKVVSKTLNMNNDIIMYKRPIYKRLMNELELSNKELRDLRIGRQKRLISIMEENNCEALLLTDPINIRYASDARNMTLFHLRNSVRYFLLINNSRTGNLKRILYESSFGNNSNSDDLELTIDEKYEPIGFTYICSGNRNEEFFEKWLNEILYQLKKYDIKSIAIEPKLHNYLNNKLQSNHANINIMDGIEIMEKSKCIKLELEIKCIKYAINIVGNAYKYMLENLECNITENKLWSYFYANIIENNCEYIETRLLSSGEKTNPWFQECSDKIIKENEIIAFDTDTIGSYGYYVDFSRSFLCPDKYNNININAEKKKLFDLAYNNVNYNINLIKPELSFKDYSFNSWNIPNEYIQNRYHVMTHGIGMTGEYPYIFHKCDYDKYGYNGNIKKNMTLCVESYIGHQNNAKYSQGVKYEEQVLVTDDGCINLTKDIPIEPYAIPQ